MSYLYETKTKYLLLRDVVFIETNRPAQRYAY